MILKPCDLVITSGVGWLSDTIRAVTQSKGEPPSVVSHAGLIVTSGDEDTAILQEAVGRVRRGTLRKLYGGKPDLVSVWRPLNLSQIDVDTILRSADRTNGKGYGWGKIILFLMDAKLLGGRYGFRRLGLTRMPFCTFDVATHFMRAGYSFGVRHPDELDPDTLWDFAVEHDDKYKMIRQLKPVSLI